MNKISRRHNNTSGSEATALASLDYGHCSEIVAMNIQLAERSLVEIQEASCSF